MKKSILALVAGVALAALPAAAQQVKVGIGAEPYPPFTSPDASGVWSGWEIDIINAVCAAEAMDCVITPVAWDGIIPALTSGQIDVIMNSMTITEDRLKTIDFSDKYYNMPAVLVGPKGMEMTPDAAGVAGKIVGVQTATIHAAYADAHFKDSAAEIKLYQTQDEANQDLVAGRIDATQADSSAMDTFVASEAGACCEIKGAVPPDPVVLGAGVGVGLRKGDADLKAKFNAGIAKILADGTYDKITANYFASSIYGD